MAKSTNNRKENGKNDSKKASRITKPNEKAILAIQVAAQPKDANAAGDIFGGWLVSQMDLAGAMLAECTAEGRVATVAIDKMVFIAPVAVGSIVSCYAELVQVGTTSMKIRIDAFAAVHMIDQSEHVAEGYFTFVALDEQGKPRPVYKKQGEIQKS